MRDELLALIPRLAQVRLVVVGDVFLDEYLVGKVERVSREAPIPVLEYVRRFTLAGGSANPAHNAAALGATVHVVGLVGPDETANELRARLADIGVGDALAVDPHRVTTLKTRVMAEGTLVFPQQVARLDRLTRSAPAASIEQALIAQLGVVARQADAILVSDYKTGVATPAIIDACRRLGEQYGKLIAVDSQGELPKYRGYDFIRAGARDAEASIGATLDTNAAFEQATRRLVRDLGARVVAIGRAEEGLSLGWGDRYELLPAVNRSEVYDVTGAGDTQVTVLTLALAAGADPRTAGILSNYAAGLVVRKVGNAVPTADELRWAVENWR